MTEPLTRPVIGIIMLDTVFPRIPGDIGNRETFDFPVIHQIVTGATPELVVRRPDRSLIEPFVEAARSLAQRGAAAITTSCGFLAIFQQELAGAVEIPVFSSSLIQIHLARVLATPGQKIGVLTASRNSLTRAHLEGVGAAGSSLAIQGMDDMPEFTSVFLGGKTTLDRAACRVEMIAAAEKLITEHPEVGPIVLECTNMPPYSGDIRRATGRPVFDVVTLTRHVYDSLAAA